MGRPSHKEHRKQEAEKLAYQFLANLAFDFGNKSIKFKERSSEAILEEALRILKTHYFIEVKI